MNAIEDDEGNESEVAATCESPSYFPFPSFLPSYLFPSSSFNPLVPSSLFCLHQFFFLHSSSSPPHLHPHHLLHHHLHHLHPHLHPHIILGTKRNEIGYKKK
jgi:hypothetical protein